MADKINLDEFTEWLRAADELIGTGLDLTVATLTGAGVRAERARESVDRYRRACEETETIRAVAAGEPAPRGLSVAIAAGERLFLAVNDLRRAEVSEASPRAEAVYNAARAMRDAMQGLV